MASTSAKSNAYFHQNNKLDPLLQNVQTQELSQDMQLKMSKKIAQLTKVCKIKKYFKQP